MSTSAAVGTAPAAANMVPGRFFPIAALGVCGIIFSLFWFEQWMDIHDGRLRTALAGLIEDGGTSATTSIHNNEMEDDDKKSLLEEEDGKYPFENMQNVMKGRPTNYSSFVCTKGMRVDKDVPKIDWLLRSCMLWNVVFYRDEKLREPMIIYHKHPNEPIDYRFLSAVEKNKVIFGLKVRISHDPIPDSMLLPSKVRKHTHIFSTYRCGDNFGHNMEDVWHTFNSMVDLHVNHVDAQVLLSMKNSGCSSYKVFESLARSVTTVRESSPVKGVEIIQTPVVLEQALLVPTRKSWFSLPTFNSPGFTRMYRDRAYQLYGLNPKKKNQVPVIGIKAKELKHRFTNHEEIVRFVTKRYAKANIVDLSVSAKSHTMRDEIKLMSELDLFISPPGGGSYGVVFVRDGTQAILGQHCHPVNSSTYPEVISTAKDGDLMHCYDGDEFVWDFFPYFRTKPIRAAGLETLVYEGKSGMRRLSFSYPVPLDELGIIVDQALFEMGFKEHVVETALFTSMITKSPSTPPSTTITIATTSPPTSISEKAGSINTTVSQEEAT